MNKLEKDIRLLKKQIKLMSGRIKTLEARNKLIEEECSTYATRSYVARCRGVEGFAR